jgi:hypothetical protein
VGRITNQLDMTLEPRLGLELIATHSTGFVVLLWLGNLVESIIFVVLEIHITFVAIVMLVRVLLVSLHRLLCVERLVAVLIGALDAQERLEHGGHAGLRFARISEMSRSRRRSCGVTSQYLELRLTCMWCGSEKLLQG